MPQTRLLSRKKWQVAKAVVITIVLLSIIVCALDPRPDISAMTIDTSSTWGEYLLAETGLPVITIRARIRSRVYVDHVSFVGSKRPVEWFQQHGFDYIREGGPLRGEISASGLVSDEAAISKMVRMHHSKARGESLYYVPDTGMLIFTTIVSPR